MGSNNGSNDYGRSVMRSKIAEDGSTVVAQVNSYLSSADLTRCNRVTAAEHLDTSPTTLGRRIKKAGYSWQELKDAERMRRLRPIMDGYRKSSWRSVATLCGFNEVNSFYRFFKDTMGMTWTEWRMRRQSL